MSTVSLSRRLALKVASGDQLQVRHFEAKEKMSSLFEVDILALARNDDIDFDAVIGREATLTADFGHGERKWTGIISELAHARAIDSVQGLSTYTLRLVPTLWLLSQRRNYRIFQQMSELAIVQQLLTEWGIEPELSLVGKYKTRKYRVQYGESDFAFMSRMLEDAGISYTFVDSADGTKLVLTDAPEKAKPRAAPLLHRESKTDLPIGFARNVKVRQQVRPGRYTLADHDYRLPATFRLQSSTHASNVAVEEKLERFHYTPGAFLFGTDKGEATPNADDHGKTRTEEREADAIAQRRLDQKRSNALTIHCETGAYEVAPGAVVSFIDHPRQQLAADKTWLVVEVSFSGDSSEEPWEHLCEMRTTAMAYRPALVTPKPKVVGVESATIVGPSGEEIHTDEFGRVRVQFHWDRYGTMDENSSCWIHTSQPWGGTAYGGVNLPRIGQEVIVDFLSGDPDRPIITGRVYTNQQKVPYKLPDHKTRSAWKSNSSPGSGGFNELMFEDLAGQELVWQQAQKNQRRLVKNDEVITVGNDRQKLVKANELETTDQNRTEVTHQDRTEITDANRTVSIGGIMQKLIGGDEIRKTIGSLQQMTAQNADAVTGGDKAESIGQALSMIIGSDHQMKIGNKHAVDAGKEIHLKAGDKVVIEAGARLTIKGPGGFVDIHSGGVDIVGNLVRINSGGSAGQGSGSSPAQAKAAAPVQPPVPAVDDVGKTGIAQ